MIGTVREKIGVQIIKYLNYTNRARIGMLKVDTNHYTQKANIKEYGKKHHKILYSNKEIKRPF